MEQREMVAVYFLAIVALACSSSSSSPNPAGCALAGQTALTCGKNSDCCSDVCVDDGLGDGAKICQCTDTGGSCAQDSDCCNQDDFCDGYSSSQMGTCTSS